MNAEKEKAIADQLMTEAVEVIAELRAEREALKTDTTMLSEAIKNMRAVLLLALSGRFKDVEGWIKDAREIGDSALYESAK